MGDKSPKAKEKDQKKKDFDKATAAKKLQDEATAKAAAKTKK